jgi:hypothetical protein
MFIVWGSQLYGKTDEVEGIGHVATRFGHLYYVPLIPMGSQFITGHEGDNYFGAPIPLSFKSIGIAWLRTISVIAVIFSLVMCFALDRGPMGGKLYPGIMLALSVGLVILFRLKWAMKASYERATQISNDLGFDPRLKVFIDLHYEMIDEIEADRRMDELNADMSDLNDLQDEIDASGMNQPVELQ